MGVPPRPGIKKVVLEAAPTKAVSKDPSNPPPWHTFEDGSYLVIANTPEIRAHDVDQIYGCMKAAYWTAIEEGLRFAFSVRNKEGATIAWLHGGDVRIGKEFKKFSRNFMYFTSRPEGMKSAKVFFNKPWDAYEFYKWSTLGNAQMYYDWWNGLPDYDPECTTYDDWPQEKVAELLKKSAY